MSRGPSNQSSLYALAASSLLFLQPTAIPAENTSLQLSNATFPKALARLKPISTVEELSKLMSGIDSWKPKERTSAEKRLKEVLSNLDKKKPIDLIHEKEYRELLTCLDRIIYFIQTEDRAVTAQQRKTFKSALPLNSNSKLPYNFNGPSRFTTVWNGDQLERAALRQFELPCDMKSLRAKIVPGLQVREKLAGALQAVLDVITIAASCANGPTDSPPVDKGKEGLTILEDHLKTLVKSGVITGYSPKETKRTKFGFELTVPNQPPELQILVDTQEVQFNLTIKANSTSFGDLLNCSVMQAIEAFGLPLIQKKIPETMIFEYQTSITRTVPTVLDSEFVNKAAEQWGFKTKSQVIVPHESENHSVRIIVPNAEARGEPSDFFFQKLINSENRK